MGHVLTKESGSVKTVFVRDVLETPLYGADNPCNSQRRWKGPQPLRAWLREAPASGKVCDDLARLAMSDEDRYKKLKKQCAAFQFAHGAMAATCREAAKAEATGLYFADIDHIAPDEMELARSALYEMPACVAVGMSLSRRGLAACFVYAVEDGERCTAAVIDRATSAVFDAADAALEYAGLACRCDRNAKNPVRWRYCLQAVDVKPDDDEVKPLSIAQKADANAVTGAPAPKAAPKAAPRAEEQRGGAVSRALDALRGMAPGSGGEVADGRVKSAILACRDAGVPQADALADVAAALAVSRPDSSRLKNGAAALAGLVSWVYDKPAKRGKRASARDEATAFFEGWRFDSFSRKLISPDGESVTMDDAGARCVRACGEVSLNLACETACAWVKCNPERTFDGLTARVRALAAAYTDADDGAIEAYAARCGFDAYEARRLTLWLYQVCGRAIKRGEKTDGMLVLTGSQGIGKTSFFDGISRALIGAGAAAYTFSAGKDGEILLATAPIVVIDELDRVLRKSDVAELKEKITATQSCVRAPYDRDPQTRLNCAVFGATTNDAAPIPAGEGEARRYWVIRARRRLAFLNDDEPVAMMREAAHEVCAALDEVGEAYDVARVDGKKWVTTADEDKETSRRNASAKCADGATIAIAAAIAALGSVTAGEEGAALFGLKTLAAVIETGNAAPLGFAVEWKAPRASASDIRRLIAARCERQARWTGRGTLNGYSLSQLASEFGAEWGREAGAEVIPFAP